MQLFRDDCQGDGRVGKEHNRAPKVLAGHSEIDHGDRKTVVSVSGLPTNRAVPVRVRRISTAWNSER